MSQVLQHVLYGQESYMGRKAIWAGKLYGGLAVYDGNDDQSAWRTRHQQTAKLYIMPRM